MWTLTDDGGFEPALVPPLRASMAPLLACDWSPHCGDALLCGGRERAVALLDLRQRRAEAWRSAPAHDGAVLSVRASPLVPHWAASGGADGVVRVWDLRSAGWPVVTLDAHAGAVESVSWSPSHAHLLTSAGRDRRHVLWAMASVEPIPRATELWPPDEAEDSLAAVARAASASTLGTSGTAGDGGGGADIFDARARLRSRYLTPSSVLGRTVLCENDDFEEPLCFAGFLGGAVASRGSCVSVSASGEVALVTLESERVYQSVDSRFDDLPEFKDAQDVERLLSKRKLATAFGRALSVARRMAREADSDARHGRLEKALATRSRALALIQLCYQV